MASSIDLSRAMMTRNTNPYVYGNAVPTQQPEVYEEPAKRKKTPEKPRIHIRRERDTEAEREAKRRSKQLHRTNKVNFLYTLGVSAIVVTMFALCVQYLNVQASVQGNQTAVEELQKQLNTITSENDETEQQINTSIDYELIYDTAVNELGMVYPERSQVITYSSTISEYVKQYKDIPDSGTSK